MQHLAALLMVMAAWTAEAGFSLARGEPLSTTDALAANVESASTLLEDAWVDTQITAQTPPLCKSLSECGWNGSTVAYADINSSKNLLLSGDASFEEDTSTPSSEAVPQPLQLTGVQSAQQHAETRLSLETEAVRLSLLLEQSCTESGPRQCWRSVNLNTRIHDTTSPRQLRPITVTFGESTDVRTTLSERLPTHTPLVTSLAQFRISNA